MLDYQLVRSHRRKTIALQVSSGQLIVRAPFGISENYIKQLIYHKQPWIQAKLQLSQQKIIKTNDHANSFKDGGQLWHLGSKKRLNIAFARHSTINDDNTNITVMLSRYYQKVNVDSLTQALKRQLADWFKQELSHILEHKLSIFALQIGVTPAGLKIRRYKARWGSCDSRGLLSFNYLLMMTPDWVIDYVIVHELCHLQYLNHSNEFWSLVERHYPDYQSAKHWLKQHQSYLNW